MKYSIAFFLSLLFFLIFLEFGSYIAVTQFLPRSVVYRQVPISRKDYRKYLRDRNPVTGWPAKNDRLRTASGTRFSPHFPSGETDACVSVFGDSFAWADEVANENAWPELLAENVGCPVSNYGVGGYGSDQAILRLKQVFPPSEIILLTYIGENILRNVNQYRDLIYPGQGFGLKPRFVYTGQSLELISLPSLSYEAFTRLLEKPQDLLPYEYFVPGGASGIQQNSFPYALRAIKAFSQYHVRAKIKGVPRYSDFYLENHPSGALDVTTEILKEFISVAEKNKRKGYIVILPLCDELLFYRKHNVRILQSLLKRLDNLGLPHIDLFEIFLDHKNGVESLFTNCGGHYNKKGNQLVAEGLMDSIGQALRSEGH